MHTDARARLALNAPETPASACSLVGALDKYSKLSAPQLRIALRLARVSRL